MIVAVIAMVSAQSASPAKIEISNFTGKWILAVGTEHPIGRGSDRPGSQERGPFGPEFSAIQTADTLTIETGTGSRTIRTIYRLDGTESRNEYQGSVPATISRVSFDPNDKSVVVLTTRIAEGPTGNLTLRCLLVGNILTIDMLSTSEKPGGPTTRELSAYKRAVSSK
jgi:hypothetical protein